MGDLKYEYKKCNIVPFLHSHTLPWYACGLSRARDQKNLCFVVVIFLVAFKRLNVSPSSFLSVWDHYCCVRCREKSIKNLQARNSAPFSWRFRRFWEFGSWYSDRIWANNANHTRRKQQGQEQQHSTATPPRPAALKQIFTSNYVPVPPRLDRGDLAKVLELWNNYCIHRQE